MDAVRNIVDDLRIAHHGRYESLGNKDWSHFINGFRKSIRNYNQQKVVDRVLISLNHCLKWPFIVFDYFYDVLL